MDGQTDMTKLKGVFCNFVNEPKINQSSNLDSWVCFGNYVSVCLDRMNNQTKWTQSMYPCPSILIKHSIVYFLYTDEVQWKEREGDDNINVLYGNQLQWWHQDKYDSKSHPIVGYGNSAI